MTRLGGLREELFPGARPIGPAGSASRAGTGEDASGAPIAWVRVMKARVPAFDALEPGDLAIVPASALAVVAATSDELVPLVSAFATAPVAGVLLVEADGLSVKAAALLDDLERALESAAIPGLRLSAADPSIVERSVIGFIVGGSAELERQAGLLEADLERRALAGEGAEAIVAAAAEFLARPLALEGDAGQVLTVHVPVAARDGAAAVSRFTAGRRDSVPLRIPLPSGGAIAMLGSRPATELERLSLTRAATLLALELARDEAVRRASDTGTREALPSGGPPWVVVLARQRGDRPDEDIAAARQAREQLRREIRLVAPARQLALRGDADSLEFRLVLAASAERARTARSDGPEAPETSPPPPTGLMDLRLPRRIAETLGRTVAVSSPFTSAADRPAAEAEARATLEAAVALPDPPAVARADRLPAYRLLGALHNLPDGARLAAGILAPLLVGRPDVRRERLQTIRAILERGGVNEAAQALGVHRNTIAYRLRRIEATTGWQLTDPDLRIPLALAVRMVQEDQI
jgi:PucR family transcriptional regulator, purine catabolism regulatory protein